MTTEILSTSTPTELAAAVERAVAVLHRGDPVALPTETVYGLAADALRADAVAQIFEAKERPFFDPLIVHLPELDWLERFVDLPAQSRPLVEALIARFWSGPLTLVLPRRPIVPDLVTAGLPTVAVRMSAHPVFRAVCRAFGSPLAAPSANRFGRISPTAAEHVRSELEGRIPLILDGGSTQHGVESTIVAVEGEAIRLLRAGPVTPEELAGVWQALRLARHDPPREEEVMAFFQRLGVSYSAMLQGGFEVRIEAPGQLESHYAPRTPLRLLPRGAHFRWSREGAKPRTGSLAFAEPSTAGEFDCEEILSPTGDLREAAATLFAKLRRLDEAGLALILAEPVPEHGLGIAIMDRLRKAAAKHVE
ncbi:MAG: L-threonylcarbamoyladenylate synthase [Chthoniobacter sp.]|jgi:L-threonylcarbamoyladenylate synthase|nr:L-threonylcarbamoyladenylate synthase [Chthoniobacter sp.]